jgi:hypothetical protein
MSGLRLYSAWNLALNGKEAHIRRVIMSAVLTSKYGETWSMSKHGTSYSNQDFYRGDSGSVTGAVTSVGMCLGTSSLSWT